MIIIVQPSRIMNKLSKKYRMKSKVHSKKGSKAEYQKYYGKLIEFLKKISKSTIKISKKTYHLFIQKVSIIIHKLQSLSPKKTRKSKKQKQMQKGGGVAGEVLTGVEDVTQGIADVLMKTCSYNSGGTGGDIGTLAEDLVGVVLKISSSVGNGLNTIDSLLELPGNLGTAYRDPGAPGANL
jgi:hypothetical protein